MSPALCRLHDRRLLRRLTFDGVLYEGPSIDEPFAPIAASEIRACLATLPDLMMDGELVVLDDLGRAQFNPLRRRALMRDSKRIAAAARETPAAVFAFDLVELRGKDLRAMPLLVRKAMLKTLLKDSTRIRYTQHVGENGVRLYQMAAELRIEGIVAKRADSPYRRGRTSDWVKIKTPAGKAIDTERAKWNR